MGARVPFLIALGGVALGAVLWFALRGGREARTRSVEPVEHAPLAPESAELRPVAPLTESEVPSVSGARDPASASPSTLASWSVRVLREGAPVVGAEVAWASPEELSAIRGEPDYVERAKRVGHRAETDAAGLARIPALGERALVVAWSGAWLAMRSLGAEAPEQPLELELQLDRTLRVRVVDPLHAPVRGVTVRARLMAGRVEHMNREVTGADGLVAFRHLGVGTGFGHGLDPALASGKLTLDGVFTTPVEAAFSLSALPAEPIELVLPACGSVVVEVRDEHGQPVTHAARYVQLERARADQSGTQIYGNRENVERELEDGVARFAHVGLDLELEAALDDRPAHEPVETVFAGPRRMGEELHATLTLRGPQTVLLLRVLHPSGEPLRGAEVEAPLTRAMGGGTISDGNTLRTDEEGRARMPLNEPWSEGTTLTMRLGYTDPAGERATAELDLSRPFPSGVSELGDVRLAWKLPLVAGRVVDAQGAPVAGGMAQVETSHERGPGQEPSWYTRFWASIEQDGRFAVHEEPPGGALRLTVENDAFMPSAPVEFAPGARELVVVLQRGGALAGTVLFPEGLGSDAFRIVAALGPDGEREATLGADGAFQLAGLPPGTATLSFQLVQGRLELLNVADLAVQDGETNHDPRLERVDLRTAVHRLNVRVHLPDGSPANAGWVRALEEHGDEWNVAAFVLEGGAAQLLVHRWPADLVVNVPGFRVVRLADVQADQEVTLEAAFEVRCELPADVPLPASASLQLTLARVGGSAEGERLQLYRGTANAGWWNASFGDERNTFDERRALSLAIQEPGAYEATFHVVYGKEGGGRMSFDIPASEATRLLDLAASAAGRTFRVVPDPRQYAERLAGSR